MPEEHFKGDIRGSVPEFNIVKIGIVFTVRVGYYEESCYTDCMKLFKQPHLSKLLKDLWEDFGECLFFHNYWK